MTNGSDAPVKGEGMVVDWGDGIKPTKPKVETTYVERRVPTHLEEKAHWLLDTFLTAEGYDPEEL